MEKPMSNFMFNMMSLLFVVRDWIITPRLNVSEAHLHSGYQVLDYGCGPGSYSLVAADLVGSSGKVYAVDIHPLALQRVQALATRKRLSNIKTIQTDCTTGLESESIDVVLLYDIYHMFKMPGRILKELHRVLKPRGILSFSDHHLREEAILTGVTCEGLFSLMQKGKRTYCFVKKA